MSAAVEPSVEHLPVFPDARFIEVEQIGAGTHSRVFRAFDCNLRRRVALKLSLQDAMLSDEHREQLATHALGPQIEALARETRASSRAALLREARRLARIEHPNVVAVLDIGQLEDGAVVVVMPLLTGGSLLDRDLGLRWQGVLEVALQIGEGLAAVHEVGLLHRDFKPDNVLFDERGQPRVADLGLACELDDPGVARERVGTGRYMAPEVLVGRGRDVRDDVYAFCTVVFEMLYGHSPFASIEARLRGEVSDIRRPGGMSAKLRAVLVAGLCPDPEQRWSSMPVVLDAMRRAARPSRAWKAVAAGATLAFAVAVGVFATLSTAEADVCEAVADELAPVWDGEVRAELNVALGTPRVGDHLQRWANRWLSVRASECDAARRSGREPIATPCSEKLRLRFAATIEALQTPQLRAGLRYSSLIAELPAPEHCLEHPDDGTWGEGGMLELHELDLQVEALLLMEEVDAARARTQAYMQLARALSSEFGLARAVFWRGEIHRLEGDLAAAAQDFELVYEDAQRLGVPLLGAEALLRLTVVAGARGDVGAVDAYAVTAAGVFAVHDVDRVAELRRVHGLGLLAAASQEDRARGLARLGEAVVLREQQLRRYGGTTELLSVALESHARGLLAVGRPSDALGQLDRARALHRSEFGMSTARSLEIERQRFRALLMLNRPLDAVQVADAIEQMHVDAAAWSLLVTDLEWITEQLMAAEYPAHAIEILYRHRKAMPRNAAHELERQLESVRERVR